MFELCGIFMKYDYSHYLNVAESAIIAFICFHICWRSINETMKNQVISLNNTSSNQLGLQYLMYYASEGVHHRLLKFKRRSSLVASVHYT